MRTAIAGIALAAGLMVAGQAAAAPYYLAYVVKDSATFLDLDRMTVDGKVVTAWISNLYEPGRPALGNTMRFSVTKMQFDCTKRMNLAQFSIYYEPDGGTLGRVENTDGWRDIIPESNGELLWTAVCDPTSRQADQTFAGPWTTIMGRSKEILEGW